MSLGENIKRYRNKVGISQDKLSKLVDVTAATIYRIEKNKVDPKFSLVERIAKVLKVKVDDLLR